MTSGGNNFNYFAENQLIKFSATDAGDFSDTYFSRIFFQDFPGSGNLKKKIQDLPGFSARRGNPVLTIHIRFSPHKPGPPNDPRMPSPVLSSGA